MSTNMAVRGEYRIDPPLKWSEIKDSAFFSADSSTPPDRDIRLQAASASTETDAGVTTIITCDRAVPLRRAPYDPRDLLEDVKELCAEVGEGHVVSGEVHMYNLDEPDAIRRVVADADGVREETASIVWPDGSTLDLSY